MPDFSVQLQALRDDASTFEAAGASIDSMTQTVQGWGDAIPDWGLLAESQQPFNELMARVAAYTTEGQTQLTAVGTNLRQVADTYQREEDDNTHASTGLY